MRTAFLILIALAGTLVGVMGLASGRQAARRADQARRESEGLRAELEKARAEARDVAARLASMIEQGRPPAAPSSAIVPAAEPGPESSVAPMESPAEPASSPLQARVDQLVAEGLPPAGVAALLKGTREAGAQDELIAIARKRVEDHPQDAQARYLLGQAYIEKLQVDPSYLKKAQWIELGLKELTKSIRLDPGYWDPRYAKGVTLSWFPDSLGKMPDAIREFEEILRLQQGSAAEPRFAGPYAQLVRLYRRSDQEDRARAMLEEGLRLFPQNEELQKLQAEGR